jgi:PAS domain S-box-containing protein
MKDPQVVVPGDVQRRILREFIATSPAGFLMLDQDLRHVEVSPRWVKDWGKDRSELLGKHHYETNPDLPERIKEAHRRGLAGEVVYAERDSFMTGGRQIQASWKVMPWGDLPQGTGGIIIYAENQAGAGSAVEEEGSASEPDSGSDSAVGVKLLSQGLSWAREGREALQRLLVEYREVACNCGATRTGGAHHPDCKGSASVPLLVRGERAVRQLAALESLLVKGWRLTS